MSVGRQARCTCVVAGDPQRARAHVTTGGNAGTVRGREETDDESARMRKFLRSKDDDQSRDHDLRSGGKDGDQSRDHDLRSSEKRSRTITQETRGDTQGRRSRSSH